MVNLSEDEVERLYRLLVSYDTLVSILLNRLNIASQLNTALCLMCNERPRDGYKYCNDCKRVLRQQTQRTNQENRRRRLRENVISLERGA